MNVPCLHQFLTPHTPSRTQPSGAYFVMLPAPADYDGSGGGRRASASPPVVAGAATYKKAHAAEKALLFGTGKSKTNANSTAPPPPPSPPVNWLMTSTDFGAGDPWAVWD